MGNSETKTVTTTKEPYFILQRVKRYGTNTEVLDTIIVKHIRDEDFELNYKFRGIRTPSEPPRIDTVVLVHSAQMLRKYFEHSAKNLMTTGDLIKICPLPGPIMIINTNNTDEHKLKQVLDEQLTLWFISCFIRETTVNPVPTAPCVDFDPKV